MARNDQKQPRNYPWGLRTGPGLPCGHILGVVIKINQVDITRREFSWISNFTIWEQKKFRSKEPSAEQKKLF